MTKEGKQLLTAYLSGFAMSLALTLFSFGLTNYVVSSAAMHGKAIYFALAVFAITQLVVQLLYFLHVGEEPRPRLNLISFVFMVMVVGIIGFGSLWIMTSLNYNMRPHDINNYMMNEEGISSGSTSSGH